MIPRLVIAGTNSGAGKTTVTVGLCGALRRLGLKVSLFKCGPDYLDPTYHHRASGLRSQNLDGWMMGRDAVLSTFTNASRASDIALIEGVMGLFDGVGSDSDTGSTAEIAKWLGAPVLLVVDAAGMSRSIAAMALGFATFDPALNVAGVICNRVGSRGHLEILQQASAQVPVVGGLPRDESSSFPERHLGLRTASEGALPTALFDTWSDHVAGWCDVDRIRRIANSAAPIEHSTQSSDIRHPTRCRIGIAVDDAFHFYYDENLRLLQQFGAELIEFSPIHDDHLPRVDGLYIGGGYPEVHAQALTGNESMRRDIHAFCSSGKPVYAECGGLMYLCTAIGQLDGTHLPMVNWFGADAIMSDRLQALGYVEAITSTTTFMGSAGKKFRGHQFRYSTHEWHTSPETTYSFSNRRSGSRSDEGYSCGNVIGSYIHAHWASNPSLPQSFVESCALAVPTPKQY
ncbi:MAG: cobyrinic acid a,c-diamide synthase [Bryobacterales bacterium]|nr:cobyrinic acid a,c-diamide synthase [Bryobacterales bacterium]